MEAQNGRKRAAQNGQNSREGAANAAQNEPNGREGAASAAQNEPNGRKGAASAAQNEPNGRTGAENAQNARAVSALLGMLGLCMRAGKLVLGTDRVCEALRTAAPGKAPLLVLEAAGTSANTHKKLTDKCNFYTIEHRQLPVDASALARALGREREIAAVGITDGELCRAVEKKLDAVC